MLVVWKTSLARLRITQCRSLSALIREQSSANNNIASPNSGSYVGLTENVDFEYYQSLQRNLIDSPNIQTFLNVWHIFDDKKYRSSFSQKETMKIMMNSLSYLKDGTKTDIATKIFRMLYGTPKLSPKNYLRYRFCFSLLQQCLLWRESITLLNDIFMLTKRDSPSGGGSDRRRGDASYYAVKGEFYGEAIVTCINAGKLGLARDLLQELLDFGGLVPSYSGFFFTKIMKAYLDNGLFQDVIKMMDLQLAWHSAYDPTLLTQSDKVKLNYDSRFLFTIAIQACNKV
jgi:hypothetical protein